MKLQIKLSTLTWVFIVGWSIILTIFFSFVVFTPERSAAISQWVATNIWHQKKTEDITNPVIIVPSINVDFWMGNSLPSVTVTDIAHPSITPTPTVTKAGITPTSTHTVTATPASHTPTPTNKPTAYPTSLPTASPTATPTATPVSRLNTQNFTRKVLMIHVDPQVACPYKSNQIMSLHACTGWNNPASMAPNIVQYFKDATNSHVNFSIVEERTYNNFTEWTSGCFNSTYWNQCSAAGNCSRPTQCTANFRYTDEEFFACLSDTTHNKCLSGETNMKKLLSEFGLPAKVNSGAIDEVWIYGAPWMSMWESQAIGPRAFSINSPAIVDTSYNRTTVIMPMSYERDLGTSIHNFSHRFEATMSKVYGGWAENRTDHNWDRFGLVKAQSPNYSYSGCGSGHYPPNATGAYDYSNRSSTVATSCDSFYSYPDLSLYGIERRNVTCVEWGCTEYGYFSWWMQHFPKYKGVGTDGKANDWWYYLLDLDNVFRSGSQVISNQ